MEKIRFNIKDNLKTDKEITKNLLTDRRVQKLIADSGITPEQFALDQWTYRDWLSQLDKCEKCPGLAYCDSNPKGYFKDLEILSGSPNVVVRKCRYLTEDDNKKAHKRNYLICDLPDKALEYELDKIELKGESVQYIEIVQMLKAWLEKEKKKGLYLHGGLGVGKSYLAACLSNHYARNGHKAAFVNIPQFFAEARNNVGNSDFVDRSIRRLQSAEILVLDDIGAENVTNWVRDDLLLPVLNYRMENELLTVFTSNSSFEDLRKRLAVNQNGQSDTVKADRIMERIRVLATPMKLEGKSRRF